MSYGLPVLSSNSTCLPEILGHNALYFDPKDQIDLMQKMEEIINNKELRNNLIKIGYKQVNKYSWAKMAREIIEVYNKLD